MLVCEICAQELPAGPLCEYSALDTHIGRTLASDGIQIMTIVQVSWCDSERDISCNYPSAFDGIPERFSAPMAEYVFLDSIEHPQELWTHEELVLILPDHQGWSFPFEAHDAQESQNRANPDLDLSHKPFPRLPVLQEQPVSG